jgi:hypothetical protein
LTRILSEGEILSGWSPNSGLQTEMVLNRGCLFGICSIAGSLGLVIGWSLGFPCWVAQQLFVLVIALDLFPSLNKIPGISYIHHGFRNLLEFYRRNPHLRSPAAVVARSVPFVGWVIMLQEWRVMVVFMLLGLPVDLLLLILTRYVWQVPVWGLASCMDFEESFAFQALMTFVYTPYLVLFALAVKWNGELSPSQRDSGSVRQRKDFSNDSGEGESEDSLASFGEVQQENGEELEDPTNAHRSSFGERENGLGGPK